jgi:hypothetical protein
MKHLKFSVSFIFASLLLYSCNAQTSDNTNFANELSEEVQVYYFHNTKRCATCNAVENETKIALELFYSEEMKSGTIDFKSLNLEDEEGKEMAKALKVSGQTLLVIKGENQVNLTNEGFMNARTNPAKFHEILKTQIDKLL